MSNKAAQTFTANGTWTAPGGTTKARVIVNQPIAPFSYGAGAAYAIMADGALYAWGLNASSQLGNASNVIPVSQPNLVIGGLPFRQVVGGTFDAFGITLGGQLYAWGQGGAGLGVNDTTLRSSPALSAAGLSFNKIVSLNQNNINNATNGGGFGFAVGGSLYAWGFQASGQLGIGNVTTTSNPTLVLNSASLNFQSIASDTFSGAYVLGLAASGSAYAWGINTNGNLGVGDVTPRSSPVAVLGALSFSRLAVNAASVTTMSAFGLTTAGSLYAWGANANGQLGVGDVTPRSSPVAVLGGLSFASIVTSLTNAANVALTNAGAAYAWGINTNGQLGVGDVTPRSSPVAVLGGLSFASVYAGQGCFYGLTAAGSLYAWGANANGQLGVGDVTPRSSPVAVLGGLTFAAVYPGFMSDTNTSTSVFAVTTDGALYSWGINTNGQLGVGDVNPRSSPVLVTGGRRLVQFLQEVITDLAVTPGTAYAITFTSTFYATFGSSIIGQQPTSVTVEWFQ